jgi:hypothetical protein
LRKYIVIYGGAKLENDVSIYCPICGKKNKGTRAEKIISCICTCCGAVISSRKKNFKELSLLIKKR